MDLLIYIMLVFLLPACLSYCYAKRNHEEYKSVMAYGLLSLNSLILLSFFLVNRSSMISFHAYSIRFISSYLLASSLVLFLILKFTWKYVKQILLIIPFRKLTFVVGIFVIIAFTFTTWNYSLMPGITFQQFIYNILVPTAFENTNFWKDIFPVFFYIGIHLWAWSGLIFMEKKKRSISVSKWLRSINIIILALCVVSSFALPISCYQLYLLPEYLQGDGHYIKDNYVAPSAENLIAPSHKQNLIYIFLESYEATYFGEDLGGKSRVNLLPELSKFMDQADWFSNTDKYGGGLPLPGMGWSIAGQVSYLSGVPLLLPFTDGNSYGLDGVFLPGITMLGDILKEQGYQQHMVMGADKTFAGTDALFTNHGNFHITDVNTKKEEGVLPQDYHISWGFEDRKLFEYSKEMLTDISRQKEPFNFTILTIDTHFPDGYAPESCDFQSDLPYERSIHCNDQEVSGFLKWVMDQPFYENTTVVLVGDHLSMDPDYFKTIETSYQRRVFNMILNSKADKSEMNRFNRSFSSTDYFPTVLASLGYEIIGDRLGLGTNLYSSTPTLLERDGLQTMQQELSKIDHFYTDEFMNVKERKKEE